ncbi:hypothetical protein Barb7_01928 [Bacteroidales bacterium Barb7]|nr:hypothetical protein Barb7_01928 [Bacteroidales bacterium Barb7]
MYFFGGDRVADIYIDGFAPFVEGFHRHAQSADAPIYGTEQVEEGSVAEVEQDGIDGDGSFADKTGDAVYPCNVAYLSLPATVKGNGTGREEADGMPFFEVLEGEAHTVDVGGGVGVGFAGFGDDGDEVFFHCPDVVEEAVYHHLEVRTAGGEDVYQHNAVEGTYRMVGDGGESTFRQRVQHFPVVYFIADVYERVGKEGGGESGTAQVAMLGVHLVHLVHLQPCQEAFTPKSPEAGLEEGVHPLEVGKVNNCFFHSLVSLQMPHTSFRVSAWQWQGQCSTLQSHRGNTPAHIPSAQR